MGPQVDLGPIKSYYLISEENSTRKMGDIEIKYFHIKQSSSDSFECDFIIYTIYVLDNVYVDFTSIFLFWWNLSQNYPEPAKVIFSTDNNIFLYWGNVNKHLIGGMHLGSKICNPKLSTDWISQHNRWIHNNMKIYHQTAMI